MGEEPYLAWVGSGRLPADTACGFSFVGAPVGALASLSFLNWKTQEINVPGSDHWAPAQQPAGLKKQAPASSLRKGKGSSPAGGRSRRPAALTKLQGGLREPRDPRAELPRPLCLRQERRGWSLAASLLPLPHPCVPGHVAPRCSGRGGFLTWGWGSQGKVGGMWGTAETRLGWSARSTAPYSPRAGRGCCLFKSLLAAGSRWPGRPGPLSFVWLCTKEGASWGGVGGACSRWEGGALPLPLLTLQGFPLGRFAH